MAGKGFLRRVAYHGVGTVLALALFGAAGAHAVTVKVSPDRATLVTLSGKPATIIVGNPTYADVAAIGDKVLVQGRNYGKTNIIVLDGQGRRLAQFDVLVVNDDPQEVALFREGQRTTYLCAPDCVQVLDTRDDKDILDDLASNISRRLGTIKLHTNQ